MQLVCVQYIHCTIILNTLLGTLYALMDLELFLSKSVTL